MMGTYGSLGWIKRPGQKEKKIALESMEKVGMLTYKNRQISQLSGGQQQRVFL
ncbi:MAG TPA: peptide transporter, partial [Aequorivita sp.]|nr:peptide transporter [Aequorivita sp.]